MRDSLREMADSVRYNTNTYGDDVVLHLELGYETLFGPMPDETDNNNNNNDSNGDHSTGRIARNRNYGMDDLPSSGLLPHKTYERLIRNIQDEKGFVESIVIMVTTDDGVAERADESSPTMPTAEAPTTSAGTNNTTSTVGTTRQQEQQEQLQHRSHAIACDLVEYLEEAFPRTNIRLHNDVFGDASRTKVMAGLASANKGAICGLSAFCAAPVLSVDEGDAIGYILDAGSMSRHNAWALRAARQSSTSSFAAVQDNSVRVFAAPILANTLLPKLTDHEILNWLRRQSTIEEGEEVVVATRSGMKEAVRSDGAK